MWSLWLHLCHKWGTVDIGSAVKKKLIMNCKTVAQAIENDITIIYLPPNYLVRFKPRDADAFKSLRKWWWEKGLFFSIWVFFHKHSQFTGQQGNREAISLTPLYHFSLLHGHLDISQAVTAGSSPLHIASSWVRTRSPWFLSASH